MQRFSQQIPWVWVQMTPQGHQVQCEVCGASGLGDANQAAYFAQTHASHNSNAGFGLGDAVAAVAKPIARAFGQQPCSPCEARRRALNAAVPRVWPR